MSTASICSAIVCSGGGVGISGMAGMGTEGKRTCCSLDFMFVTLSLALYCHSDVGTNDEFLPMTDANESSTWQWNWGEMLPE